MSLIPERINKIQAFIDHVDAVLAEWDRVKQSHGLTQEIIEEGARILRDAKNGVK